jgi:hypothetical protein
MSHIFWLLCFLLPVFPVVVTAETSMDPGSPYTKGSRLTVENINKVTDVLRDPTRLGDKVIAKASELTSTYSSRLLTNSAGGASSQKNSNNSFNRTRLNDPTQLSGNFRAAMQQMKVRSTTTQLRSTGELPEFPKISLAAIVYSEDQNAYSMLHINDQTVLVRVGDKASFVDNGKVVEVVVQEINRSDVRLAIFPAEEIIILR